MGPYDVAAVVEATLRGHDQGECKYKSSCLLYGFLLQRLNNNNNNTYMTPDTTRKPISDLDTLPVPHHLRASPWVH